MRSRPPYGQITKESLTKEQMVMLFKLNLHMFGEGGAEGGAEGSAPDAGSGAEVAVQQENPEADFEELIKGHVVINLRFCKAFNHRQKID